MLTASCSVKKRAYMSGYHIEWAFAKKKKETIHQVKEQKNSIKKEAEVADEVVVAQPPHRPEIFASSNNKTPDADLLNLHRNFFSEKKDSCGDLISFRNGNELKGKVLEINETQIKYKRCDNIDGPMMIVNKNDIAFIKYANGQSETFVKDPAEVKKNNPNAKLQMHPLALASVIFTIALGACLLLSIIIPGFGLLALLFSVTAVSMASEAKKKLMRKEIADKYTGLSEAKVCFIINWVFLGLFILATLIVLYFVFSFII